MQRNRPPPPTESAANELTVLYMAIERYFELKIALQEETIASRLSKLAQSRICCIDRNGDESVSCMLSCGECIALR